MNQFHKKTKGFSLVELSIVIVIIALIIAGVSAGKSLATNARHRQIISSVNQYRLAYNSFISQYNAYPGDIKDATAKLYWPNTRGGNGDKKVGVYTSTGNSASPPANSTGSRESTRFWEHLAFAGLISGSYNGHLINNSLTAEAVPKITSDAYLVINYYAAWGNPHSANTVYLISLDGSDVGIYYFFTPQEAKSIDTKADDGNPRWGMTYSRQDNATNTCLAGANDIYNLTTTAKVCAILFYLQ